MRNQIAFRLWGKYGLFTDPVTKMGGEKSSYPIPTYQALKGIVESIYWKPTLTYIIDEVRVIHPIRMESKGVRPLVYNDGTSSNLAYYSYLKDPCYEVKVHFIFNAQRPDLKKDYNENKHYEILKRSLERGGRRDIFLGSRECQGYVEPCRYGELTGAYDEVEIIEFGLMFHGFNYPDETGKEEWEARLWHPKMEKGIVKFISPKDCSITRSLRKMRAKKFSLEDITSVNELHGELSGGI